MLLISKINNARISRKRLTLRPKCNHHAKKSLSISRFVI
uniref:Uncharacterized protein n=1 Tax=Fervidicoccus fontis TaxID=683846 RepID=A0A7C1E3R7_9CREN